MGTQYIRTWPLEARPGDDRNGAWASSATSASCRLGGRAKSESPASSVATPLRAVSRTQGAHHEDCRALRYRTHVGGNRIRASAGCSTTHDDAHRLHHGGHESPTDFPCERSGLTRRDRSHPARADTSPTARRQYADSGICGHDRNRSRQRTCGQLRVERGRISVERNRHDAMDRPSCSTGRYPGLVAGRFERNTHRHIGHDENRSPPDAGVPRRQRPADYGGVSH